MAAAFREGQRTEKAVQPSAAASGQAEEELMLSVIPRAGGESSIQRTIADTARPKSADDYWMPAGACHPAGRRPDRVAGMMAVAFNPQSMRARLLDATRLDDGCYDRP